MSYSGLCDVELLEYETSTRVLSGSRLQCFVGNQTKNIL